MCQECLLPHCCHDCECSSCAIWEDLFCVRISIASVLSHECSSCAISCSQTCYVSECPLPYCCQVNVPTVPSLIPRPVVSECLLPHSCHVNVPTVPSLVPRPVVSECLLPHCCHMVFQLFHQFPDLLCQNVCCPTAVTWMFQQCHRLFQHLLCVVWISVVYCSLKYCECCSRTYTGTVTSLNQLCDWFLVASYLLRGMFLSGLLPWSNVCLNLCCRTAVSDSVNVAAVLSLFCRSDLCLKLCCPVAVSNNVYITAVPSFLLRSVVCESLQMLQVNAHYSCASRSDVCQTFCCITAGWRDVNIMAVPWLLPGYLSESLLLHSYWNGCEYYGCVVTFYYISCVLDSPLPHSCCCAITSPCVCCVSKSLIAATGDLNGMAVLWHLCGSVVFLNFCCLQLLQGMWTLLAVSS